MSKCKGISNIKTTTLFHENRTKKAKNYPWCARQQGRSDVALNAGSFIEVKNLLNLCSFCRDSLLWSYHWGGLGWVEIGQKKGTGKGFRLGMKIQKSFLSRVEQRCETLRRSNFDPLTSSVWLSLTFCSGRKLDRVESLGSLFIDLWRRISGSNSILYQSSTSFWRSKLCWQKERISCMQ